MLLTQANGALTLIRIQGLLLDERASMSSIHALCELPNLEVLDLQDCRLTSAAAIALAHNLPANQRLQEIRLGQHPYFNDDVARAFSDALFVNSTLRVLDLGYDYWLEYQNTPNAGITNAGAIALAGALKYNTGLEYLSLGTINPNGRCIDDVGEKALCETLLHNAILISLRLHGKNLRAAGYDSHQLS